MIRFHTNHKIVREQSPIKPSSNFIPTWIKMMPPYDTREDLKGKFAGHKASHLGATLKSCYGVKELFMRSYILPMWTDTWITSKEDKTDVKQLYTLSSPFVTRGHDDYQMSTWMPNKSNFKSVVKFDNVWKYKSDTYDLLQFPCLFHVDNDFTSLMGVVPSASINMWKELNIHIIPLKDEVFIKRGTPLLQYIPIPKQQKMKIEDKLNKKDKQEMSDFIEILVNTSFPFRFKKALKWWKNKK